MSFVRFPQRPFLGMLSQVILLLNFTVAANAEIDSLAVEVLDRGTTYSFGSEAVIPIDSLHMPAALAVFLDSCGADSIRKVFPEANPADTLFTRPSGIQVILPDLSHTYCIHFSGPIDWTSFESGYYAIDTLSRVSQVGVRITDDVTPNDPYFLSNQMQYLGPGSTSNGRTSIARAWSRSRGKSGQLIGMVDIGIDAAHPDFVGVDIEGVNADDDNVNDWNVDPGDHGTSVAGILVAKPNNGVGVAGINWRAKLFIADLDPPLSGPDYANGIDWCVRAGCVVVNASGGGYPVNDAEIRVGKRAWLQDVSLVASKGNDGIWVSNHGPSDVPCYIAVSAVSPLDGRLLAGISNYGFNTQMAAPGTLIFTTGNGGGYRNFENTSAATPQVSGALSLLRAEPILADIAEGILYLTANDPVHSFPGWDDQYGYGIVNAEAALEYLHSHDFHHVTSPHQNLALYHDWHSHKFYNPGGGLNGDLLVQTYRASAYIDYSYLGLTAVPDIIIRNRDVTGYNAENPNYQIPYCKVSPGTATTTGCVLETWVYKVNSLFGPDYWVPTAQSVSLAATISVPHTPKKYDVGPVIPDLKQAIKIAKDGDTLGLPSYLAGPNNRNVNLDGRRVVIRPYTSPGLCVIDCQNQGRAFIFDGFEPSQTRLEDVEIWNASNSDSGGGILIHNSSPTIRNVTFKNCQSPRGGAIFVSGAFGNDNPGLSTRPNVINCKFEDNLAISGQGGAISIGNKASVNIDSSRFTGNTASKGGAVHVEGFALQEVAIRNSLFRGNSAATLGGAVASESNVTIEGNTIVLNSCAGVRPATLSILSGVSDAIIRRNLFSDNFSYATDFYSSGNSVECNNWWSNAPGNFNPSSQFNQTSFVTGDNNTLVNPLFCSVPSNDFTLRWDSPCDANNNPCGGNKGAFRAECGPGVVLVYPLGSTSDITPQMNWDDVPFGTGVGHYRIEIDNDSSFGSPERALQPIAPSQWTVTPSLPYGTYYWRVKAYNLLDDDRNLESAWSPTGSFILTNPGGGGGGSCPFVYTWDGSDFVLEDAILTASEKLPEGTPVSDYLPLTFTPALEDGVYRLRIHEEEAEKTFLDNTQLLVVDHTPGYQVTVSTEGDIIFGNGQLRPLVAVDDKGNDVTPLLLGKDDQRYECTGAGSLTATFNRREGEIYALSADDEDSTDPGGDFVKQPCEVSSGPLGQTKPEPATCKIEVEDAKGTWHELPTGPARLPKQRLRPVIDLSGYDLPPMFRIRYTWDKSFSLDDIALAVQVSVAHTERRLSVEDVRHSSDHASAKSVSQADGNYAELVTGEYLDLTFSAEPVPEGMARSLVLVTKGYFLQWFGHQDAGRPLEFGLNGNYPNPFNPSTTIRYSLADKATVNLEIFNLLGQQVRTLVSGAPQTAGSYEVFWDGRDDRGAKVGSGAYLYRLTANELTDTRRMILLK